MRRQPTGYVAALRFPTKHISFLELARTTTSRGMVMRIGVARGLQLHDRNSPLLAAGFAPACK